MWLTSARRKLSSRSTQQGIESSGADRLEMKISTLPMAGGLAGGGVRSSGPEEREPGNIAGKAGGVDGLIKLLD